MSSQESPMDIIPPPPTYSSHELLREATQTQLPSTSELQFIHSASDVTLLDLENYNQFMLNQPQQIHNGKDVKPRKFDATKAWLRKIGWDDWILGVMFAMLFLKSSYLLTAEITMETLEHFFFAITSVYLVWLSSSFLSAIFAFTDLTQTIFSIFQLTLLTTMTMSITNLYSDPYLNTSRAYIVAAATHQTCISFVYLLGYWYHRTRGCTAPAFYDLQHPLTAGVQQHHPLLTTINANPRKWRFVLVGASWLIAALPWWCMMITDDTDIQASLGWLGVVMQFIVGFVIVPFGCEVGKGSVGMDLVRLKNLKSVLILVICGRAIMDVIIDATPTAFPTIWYSLLAILIFASIAWSHNSVSRPYYEVPRVMPTIFQLIFHLPIFVGISFMYLTISVVLTSVYREDVNGSKLGFQATFPGNPPTIIVPKYMRQQPSSPTYVSESETIAAILFQGNSRNHHWDMHTAKTLFCASAAMILGFVALLGMKAKRGKHMWANILRGLAVMAVLIPVFMDMADLLTVVGIVAGSMGAVAIIPEMAHWV